MKLKVLVADDHPVILKGVRQILEEAFDLEVIHFASTAEEAVQQAAQNDYDIIILDVSMPAAGGVEALRRIKKGKPDQPVLMYSLYPEEQYGVQSLKAGAAGYLSKDTIPEKMVEAIKTILGGAPYISDNLRAWMEQTP